MDGVSRAAMKNRLKHSSAYRLYRFLLLRRRLLTTQEAIAIELTDRCNLRCGYCPKGNNIRVGGGDMDFGFFKTVVAQASHLGAKQVALVGFGEPLLYPYLFEAISHIRSNYPAMRTCLTTNGVLLDDAMSRKLIESGLDQITISINFNSNAKYALNNRAKVFERVVENAIQFLRLLNSENRLRKPQTYIQILENLNTPSEIIEFKNFWRPHLGPNALVQVQPLVNWGGLVRIENRREEGARYPCSHLLSGWIVTKDGKALACCMVFPYNSASNELILGNIRDNSLEQLGHGAKATCLRLNNMNCEYEKMPTCNKCDAYWTAPNIYIRNPFYPLVGTRWL